VAFQPPSKSFTSRDFQFIALVTVLISAVSVTLVFANLTLTGGGSFYTNWVASRGFLFERSDPYGADVPTRVQQLIYNRPARPHEEPFILTTPFHLLLLYFPFSLFSDPQLARSIFTLFLELGLLWLAALSLQLTEWEAPRYFWALFLLFCSLNFYTFQAILTASPVLLLGLGYAGILSALRADYDELAGALFALSLYYWEVGAPFLILVIWRMYREKRGRFFAGFGMLTIILGLISLLLYPGWILPYLRAVTNNLRADFGFSVQQAFTVILSLENHLYSQLFIGILLLALGYEWSLALDSDFRRFYWVCCLSLAATPLLGFRTDMQNLSVLIIPLALVFAIVYDRWRRLGHWLIILLLLAIFLFPWAAYFFILPVYQTVTTTSLYFLLPLGAVIALYWVRWWAINPPRVWSDLISSGS